jgi:hypothetical protein
VQENQAFSAGQVSLQEKRLDSVVFLVEVQKDSPVEGAKVSQNERFGKIIMIKMILGLWTNYFVFSLIYHKLFVILSFW